MVINSRNNIMVDMLVEMAEDFANEAHEGQTRKYTHEPYFNHVYSVAQRLREFTSDEEMIAAALLHDTVEDTNTTIEDIFEVFGLVVAELVYDLTDHFTKKNYPKLNREKRKFLEAKRMGRCSDKAKLIKLCDLADNTASIVEHDPGFARVYFKEKAILLEEMGY